MLFNRSNNWFVAYVAEIFLTSSTLDLIDSPLLLIDNLTVRTSCAELKVYKVSAHPNQFVFQVIVDFFGLELTSQIFALRVLLEVFLSFSDRDTDPAKPSVATRTLHMGAF